MINSAAEMSGFGRHVAALHKPPFCIYLVGPIGAGKTTFAKGFVKRFGFKGPIKSPTFTIVESYYFDSLRINHFDLFRLNAAAELEHIGVEDYVDRGTTLLIEWPEIGAGYLPEPDVTLSLSVSGSIRRASVMAESEKGEQLLLDINSAAMARNLIV